MPVNTNQTVNSNTILNKSIHLVAASSPLEQKLAALLDMIQQATGAHASFLVLDDQTTYSSGSIDTFPLNQHTHSRIAAALQPGLNFDPALADISNLPHRHILAPITQVDGDGLFWLVTGKEPTEMAESDIALLQSLVTLLQLVVSHGETQREKYRAKQFTTSILTSITDPLFVLDVNRCIILTNPAAQKLFGLDPAQTRGQSLADVVRSDELMALTRNENRTLKEWTNEAGQTFVPRMVATYDTENQLVGYVLALRDITHFKKLNRNQSEFTRIVSHDLRSPLTSMQGFASMLEMGVVGELNDKQAQFVDKILSGITQMTSLVENIQDAGRYDPETGFYEVSRAPCDLYDIVRRIVGNNLMPAEKQELELTVELAEDLPVLNADATMLERAITNLVDNAIKYTPNGGRVQVSARRNTDSIVISVSDTGLGISQDHQKHLFERHVRIPRQEHKKIKGSGLGLFIVRSVAQRHGGDAWVESIEGKGSTFSMSIPLNDDNLLTTTEST